MHMKGKTKWEVETKYREVSHVKSSMASIANPDKFIFWYNSILRLNPVSGDMLVILLKNC